MLSVEISDFGPITAGQISLRPLTVFVGPNNSGKSYFAMLLYALHRALGPNVTLIAPRRFIRRPTRFYPYAPFFRPRTLDLSDEHLRILTDWLTRLAEEPLPPLPITVKSAPVQIQHVMTNSIRLYFTEFVTALNREIQRCYGSNIVDLVRRGDGPKTFSVSVVHPQVPWSLRLSSFQGELRTDELSFDLSDQTLPLTGRRLSARVLKQKALRQEAAERLLVEFHEGTLNRLQQALPGFTYYFPAARSGILHSHKALASFLVTQSPLVGLQRIDIPQLSGVITDFIGDLLTLDTHRKTRLFPVAAFLEEKVISGQVVLEAGKLEYPQILYEAESARFPLHRTSSMVSELAPVILFLKYLIEPGDFLIIEEPESHLHPASQRRLAWGIARLVRENVRVLITTHSDYFLGQLSNFIRLSQPDVRARRKFEYAEEVYISPSEVGAYLFDFSEDKRGRAIREIPVTAEDGISEEEFTKVAQGLYDETIQLQR